MDTNANTGAELFIDQWHVEFNPDIAPVAEAAPGDTLIFKTLCCSKEAVDRRISTSPETFRAELNYTAGMPITGPVAVQGAQVGDTLMLEILDLQLAPSGWTMASKGKRAIGRLLETAESRIIPIQDGYGIFEDKYRIPVNPMIGCIGTTPAEPINAGWPGYHGGNLDCKTIGAGTKLFLPVLVPGANLALGDLHAIQGDGEVGCAGVEISGRVTLRTRLLRGASLPLPLLETRDALAAIVTEATLDEAALHAVERMTLFLAEFGNLSVADAGMLLSLVGDIRICQIVDPAMTCRMEVPKTFLQQQLKMELDSLWEQFEVR